MENVFLRGKLLSLFDGIGCFPLALANKFGVDYKDFEYLSSEKEEYLKEILDNNFNNVKHLGVVEDLDLKDLKNQNISLITMGTPCTGFSLSGKRDGLKNVESRLFSDGVKVIKELQPEYIIWENVFGVLSNNKGQDFRSALQAFAEAGYNLVWTTYDSKYFGIPQKRRRVYLIGVRKDLKQAKILPYIDPFYFYQRGFLLNKSLMDYKKIKDLLYKRNTFKKGDKKIQYFNRHRSDLFVAEGLVSTLAKRDYKSYGDLIIYDGKIRRETPKERLRFQGMPDIWFEGLNLSDNKLYRANGMSLPVVESVMESLKGIQDYDYLKMASKREVRDCFIELKKEVLSLNSENYQKLDNLMSIQTKGQTEGRMFYSGMILDNGEGYDCLFLNELPEIGSPSDRQKMEYLIGDLIDVEAPSKYELSQRAKEGILRREQESGKPLPQDLKSIILKDLNKIKD